MIRIATKLAIYDILTFGVGIGLILTQPEESWGYLVGQILMVAGFFVQIYFLKMISCIGRVRA